MPGPRPPGMQQRPPNGATYQSPTMVHSPQQHGAGHAGPQQPHMPGPMGSQGPMAPMRNPMLPPHAMMSAGQPGMPQQPTHAFQPHPGSSASHPNSPAAHMNQSPSLATRLVPMQPRNNQPTEIKQLQEAAVNSELIKIDASRLQALKLEAGVKNVDLPSMALEDKVSHRL